MKTGSFIRVYFTSLLLGLWFWQPCQAQFNSYEPGVYILRSAPTAVQQAGLKLRGSHDLLIKTTSGAKLKLTPKEVAGFRIGDDKYVAVGPFSLRIGLGTLEIAEGFAQPLEMGGEVELLHYEFSTYNAKGSAYLLRRGPVGALVGVTRTVGIGSSGGLYFREQVRPFLASRPDLIKYLDEKRINLENLFGAIVALNQHVPFTPPAALNLE